MNHKFHEIANHLTQSAVRLTNSVFLHPIMVAALGSVLAAQATAQTFTTLYNFTGGFDGMGTGENLKLSGNTLYGTTRVGGSSGNGAVFKINTDGTGFTTLYSFTALSNSIFGAGGTNGDGADPRELLVSGNTLYGTAFQGGSSGYGTVFAIGTDGSGFRTLHSFTATSGINPQGYPTNSDGNYPVGDLILSGNMLYGTTEHGGSLAAGTIFAVSIDGTGFTTIFNFTPPFSEMGLSFASGDTLYGTGEDAVFKINTDGTGFTILHSLTGLEGAGPNKLILSGNTMFGTAVEGGSSNYGTVFSLSTDGTDFRTLHSFSGGSDGGLPQAGLVLLQNSLYGTVYAGGGCQISPVSSICANGTIFSVSTDGSAFTTLHTFSAYGYNYVNSDGAIPSAGLTLSGSTFYGAAGGGGNYGFGTLFSLSFSPRLTIGASGSNVVLSWPANVAGFDYSGFTLQSTTNLGSPVWSANLPAPVVVNGLNTVTNLISGTKRFFRLSQ